MQNLPSISHRKLFVAYAQENPDQWQALIGQSVSHVSFGVGTIKSADSSYVEICFIDDQKDARKFKSSSIENTDLFLDIQLPTNTEEMKETRERLQAKFCQNNFLNLKIKYGAQSCRMTSTSSPLYSILLKIDSDNVIQDEEIKLLEENRLFNTLVIYFQNEYQKTNDLWYLVKTCRYLRDADKPHKVIELTNQFLESNDKADTRVKSALLTTRGGAFRDLRDLLAAEQCANEAIKHHESLHSYNLLGAIYFELGEPKQGEACFLRALQLGGKLNSQEYQMQNALKNAGQSERNIVAQFLLERDPEKYKWAEYYLNQNN